MNRNLVFHCCARVSLGLIVIGVVIWGPGSRKDNQESFDLDSVFDTSTHQHSDVGKPRTENKFVSSAFDLDLWHMPQEPQRAAQRTEAPQIRLNVLLLAISTETDESGDTLNEAVIYDVEQDKVMSVQVGDSVGSYRVALLTDDRVELTYGQRKAVLELEVMERGT